MAKINRLSVGSWCSQTDCYSFELSRVNVVPSATSEFALQSHLSAPQSTEPSSRKTPEPSQTTADVAFCHTLMSIGKDVHQTERHPNLEINRDLKTRNVCILALVLGWAIAIALIVTGVCMITSGLTKAPEWLLNKVMSLGNINYQFDTFPPGNDTPIYYIKDHWIFQMPKSAMTVASLLLSVVLTLIFDEMNYIHSISLRWALWHEGNLTWMSLPRLWTTSKHHAANSWYTNVASVLAMVLAYGSISLITINIYLLGLSDPDSNEPLSTDIPGTRYGLDISAYGCIGFGVGLVLQATVSTFALCTSGIVGSWNSSVLSMTKACVATPPKQATNLELLQTTATEPECRVKQRQSSARDSVPGVARLLHILWAQFVLVAIWTFIVGFLALHNKTTTAAYVKKITGRLDALSYWTVYGQVSIPFSVDIWTNRRDWAGLLIQCTALAPFILSLHAAEVVANMSRDEAVWRKATSVGAIVDGSHFLESMCHYETRLIFFFKSFIPWVFGAALNPNLNMWMALLPLCALTLICLLLVGFAESVARKTRKGTQPPTYGDVCKIMKLVDEWEHRTLYWGDKKEERPGVRRAGTAGKRLEDLNADYHYVGITP